MAAGTVETFLCLLSTVLQLRTLYTQILLYYKVILYWQCFKYEVWKV